MSSDFWIITTAALADSVNPCAASVLFLSLGFLFSLNTGRKRVIALGSLYILGIFTVYILIGLGILSVLSILGIPRALSRFGGLVLILTSLINLAALYIPKFSFRLTIPEVSKPRIAAWMYRASLPASLLLGLFVGMVEFPCTGGPYLMILTLLHDRSSFSAGFWYLLYYNVVFVLPLGLILAAATSPVTVTAVQNWRRDHARTANAVIALITLALGVIIIR